MMHGSTNIGFIAVQICSWKFWMEKAKKNLWSSLWNSLRMVTNR